MNDSQRQLLADKIDELERTEEKYQSDISKLMRQLAIKQDKLNKVQEELENLSEGIDW